MGQEVVSMAKLSVMIITKNEEDNIGQCLESVKWADEIIVPPGSGVPSYKVDKVIGKTARRIWIKGRLLLGAI